MEGCIKYDVNNLKATELRLGLPGTDEEHPSTNTNNKRPLPQSDLTPPPAKTQIVGWPPVRSYRKNSFPNNKSETKTSTNPGSEVGSEMSCGGMYVKVSMEGAAYLRKIDLKVYGGYPELLKALEKMFNLRVGRYSEREGYKGSDYAPTYQDKDGDWMLVGDVPWDMFVQSCNKLRIIKGSIST